MSEWNYIVAAYLLTWAVLGGYALYIRSRERRARAGWRHLSQDEEARS